MNNQLEVIRKLIESNDSSRINLASVMLENVEDKEDFKIIVTKGNFELLTSNNYLFDYLDFSRLERWDITKILKYSPISEKIWDSNKLDLSKLSDWHIKDILKYSPISEKIWNSGKLNHSHIRYITKELVIR